MRTQARALIASTLLWSFMAGLSVPAHAASIVAYSFSGTITNISNGAEVLTGVFAGDRIAGAFAYDSTQLGSNGLYNFTGSNLTHALYFNIYNSANTVQFQDSYTGNPGSFYGFVSETEGGTNFSLAGDSTFKQQYFNFANSGTFAFDLSLAAPGYFGGQALPTSSTIGHFVSNTAILTWDPPPDLKFSAQIDSFAPAVFPDAFPEPSTLLMTILAIATCAAGHSISRYRSAVASRSG
jgi:hypothetical protein